MFTSFIEYYTINCYNINNEIFSKDESNEIFFSEAHCASSPKRKVSFHLLNSARHGGGSFCAVYAYERGLFYLLRRFQCSADTVLPAVPQGDKGGQYLLELDYRPRRKFHRLVQLLPARQPVFLAYHSFSELVCPLSYRASAYSQVRLCRVYLIFLYQAFYKNPAGGAPRRTSLRFFRLFGIQYFLQPFSRSDHCLSAASAGV